MDTRLVVVDSSVCIDHLKSAIPRMVTLLQQRRPLLHPLVQGEILVGNVRDRSYIRSFLGALEKVALVENALVLENLELWRAYDRGIGWIDMHILRSAYMSGSLLWTRDRRLGTLAEALGVRFVEA